MSNSETRAAGMLNVVLIYASQQQRLLVTKALESHDLCTLLEELDLAQWKEILRIDSEPELLLLSTGENPELGRRIIGDVRRLFPDIAILLLEREFPYAFLNSLMPLSIDGIVRQSDVGGELLESIGIASQKKRLEKQYGQKERDQNHNLLRANAVYLRQMLQSADNSEAVESFLNVNRIKRDQTACVAEIWLRDVAASVETEQIRQTMDNILEHLVNRFYIGYTFYCTWEFSIHRVICLFWYKSTNTYGLFTVDGIYRMMLDMLKRENRDYVFMGVSQYDAVGTVKELYTMADGKMYHMPGYITDDEAVERAQQKTNAGNLYVRQDVYNEMGRPDMSTPESFAAVLERVKNEYPDLIPLNLGYIYLTDYSMTPALKSIFNGFGVQPQGVGGDQPSVVYLEEDQVKLPYRDPNYKKALQYVNSLYRKGILTDSLLIQRQSQIDQRLNNAEYFCTGEYTSNIHTVLNPSLRQNFGEEIQYEIVDPAFASEGVTPQYPTVKSKGWMTAVITKNAKQPDRLIKFLEFCYSELGQRTMIMGKEGETYDMVDGVPKMREEYVQFKLDNNTQELNKLGFNNFAPFLMRKKYLDLYETPILQGKRPELEGDWEKMNRYATDLYAKGLGDIGPRMGSKDYVSYSRVMEQFMKNMLKMMSAKTDEDFESLYETGVKNADNAGAAEVEALLTKNHQYELEQLG